MSITQPVALVTGSSSGIGRLTAISLAAKGWNVILSGRRESELKETAKMCAEKAKEGVTSVIVPGDVGKEENVKVLFGRIKEIYGRLDLLFNVGCQGVFLGTARIRHGINVRRRAERRNLRESSRN
jgi:NAD(P)-dependent dehydrogenase (short-subunit alcohol dehydrogenase family)